MLFETYNNTIDLIDMTYILLPILSMFILVLLFLIGLYIFLKYRNWLVSFIILIFTIIFATISFETPYLPFTPYLQVFFILIQIIFFIKTSIDVYYS